MRCEGLLLLYHDYMILLPHCAQPEIASSYFYYELLLTSQMYSLLEFLSEQSVAYVNRLWLTGVDGVL